MAHSLFPHTNLAWGTGNQEARIRANPDSVDACTSAARHLMSHSLYHDGGSLLLSRALSHLRTCADLAAPISDAHALAAIAHIANDQADRAEAILNIMDGHNTVLAAMAWSHLHRHQDNIASAITAAVLATSLAPLAWETHSLLARQLQFECRQNGASPFKIDKLLLSLTRALTLGAAGTTRYWLQETTGARLMDQKKYTSAQRIFEALRTDISTSQVKNSSAILSRVSFRLGIITTHGGKYTNALAHFRACLKTDSANADVYAWMAKAHLHLGEIKDAMEACSQALAISPDHVLARMALGSAHFENRDTDAALEVLKTLLADAPQMTQVFTDIVNIRANENNSAWLLRVLRAEVKRYERMPVRTIHHVKGHGDIPVKPRATTLKRIEILLATLADYGQLMIEPLIESMDLTTDEGLRFRLWEAALTLLSTKEASHFTDTLNNAGELFSRDTVGNAILLVDQLHPEALHRGVWVTPEDLDKAASTRFPDTQDAAIRRRNIEQLREEARIWQATLLVTLGNATDKNLSLLRDWSQRADDDLSTACQIGLAASGDETAQQFVKARASKTLLHDQVTLLCTPDIPIKRSTPPRFTDADDTSFCRSCGEQPTSANTMIREGVGLSSAALCTGCLIEIIDASDTGRTNNPATSCNLCGTANMANVTIYRHQGCEVCDQCLQLGLRRINQAEISRFLHTL